MVFLPAFAIATSLAKAKFHTLLWDGNSLWLCQNNMDNMAIETVSFAIKVVFMLVYQRVDPKMEVRYYQYHFWPYFGEIFPSIGLIISIE